MSDVTAIILAAGMSRRMGQQNKLLLPVGDVPMIRHVVDVYATVTNQQVVVVTGHEATKIDAALAGSNARTVLNDRYAEGQSTSVACGLRAADNARQILVGLGDQPLLTVADIQSLLLAHLSADPDRISIPLVNEQRGNPILVPGVLTDKLLADPRSPGCKKFTRTHPEHVQFHDFVSTGFCTDVDTPEAYAALGLGQQMEVT